LDVVRRLPSTPGPRRDPCHGYDVFVFVLVPIGQITDRGVRVDTHDFDTGKRVDELREIFSDLK
jgi:hypothetical protein